MLRLGRAVCFAACCLCSGLAQTSVPVRIGDRQPSQLDVWIGTAAHPQSRGIYHVRLNPETGQLSTPRLVAESIGPEFLAMHPRLPLLYAIGRFGDVVGVAAYAIDQTGIEPNLEFLNAVEIGDGGATHLAVDPQGKMLVTAQYGGGSVAVFPLRPDGRLDERIQLLEHSGGSQAAPERQAAPHPHWVGFSPDGRFVFVPDLGLDRILIYRCDRDQVRLEPHGSLSAPPGSGPRHMKFHPQGGSLYVLNELTLTVSLFHYDSEHGTAELIETVPTVPQEQWRRERTASASEIRIHPNGRVAYAANRGHDTITVLAIDPQSKRLTTEEHEPVRGATPRNFNLDPEGRWLLAAGQDSHTLAVFAVDSNTGALTYQQSIVSIPAPICVLFQHE